MKFIIVILACLIGSLNAETFKLWESKGIGKEEYKKLLEQNRNVIFPGTKWCGDGDEANDYDDLGEHASTDICCRAHDHCPDIILGHESKYNLTNEDFYTKLNCECDQAFHACLTASDAFISDTIGTLYFTLLGTECFKYEYPILKCLDWDYFPWPKCIEYELDTTKPKLYQWFDLPNY